MSKEDINDYETKDTKHEKNLSFISMNQIKTKKDMTFVIDFGDVQQNKERILRNIKAKKMQKSLLKSNIYKTNPEKHTNNNYCANCSIF